MTLSSLTAFSGFTEQAPLSPSYFNAKLAEVYTNLNQVNSLSTDFGAITSGSTTTFPVSQAMVLRSYDSGGAVWNVRALGLAGDGATDDAPALRSALSLNAGFVTLYFPIGIYNLGSTVTISKQAKIFGGGGQGSVTLMKTHNGDAFHVTGDNVFMHGIDIEGSVSVGSAASYGRAIWVTGTTANNFKFLASSINNVGIGIEFDNDCGTGSMIDNCRIAPWIWTTSDNTAISINSDTAARQRFISNMVSPGAKIVVTAGLDTFITNCAFTHPEIGPTAFSTHIQGCRFGNSSSTFTIQGSDTCLFGNAISGGVILAPGWDGSHTGNIHSAGRLVSLHTASNFLIVDPNLIQLGPSFCTLDLNQAKVLSWRTIAGGASATSANLLVNEMAFQINASGASLALRSGGTVWYFGSSLSTKG